ncbi:MAG: tRNA (uridine(54)-C5)-methyltransferase TrmA [Helicobacteraceae bacterium]|jgi:tRNA (uracil-5-)-methyltransferase|nr:tRNA (uridine(54)-C5)-methyltransferase TrmA [Helicobacteraceae bacterium]
MKCEFFGICGGCALAYEYNEQFTIKKKRFLEEFIEFNINKVDEFLSEELYFRNRGEFRVWKEDSGVSCAMFAAGGKKLICISDCPIVNKRFDMIKIVSFLNENTTFSAKLFEIDFLASTNEKDIVISFIFHRELNDELTLIATHLAKKLNANIILRSRKQKVVIGNDYIIENFTIAGVNYSMKQLENSFSQPNGGVNQKMTSWVYENTLNINGDLLELYCGNGNFTILIAKNFAKVLAIEVAANSLQTARENAIRNNAENISFARLSAAEFASAYRGDREFNRLKEINLKSFNFKTIFVDPPRAGMDNDSIALAAQFDKIIYISCNQETLKRDLLILTQTHNVISAAIFDQFPYSNHLESGIILERRKSD